MNIVDLFVQVLNMSISASIVALCLALLRFLFRKRMTAGFTYLMWALVLVRLWVPVAVPVGFSLFNLFSQSQGYSGTTMVSIEYIENTGSFIPLEREGPNLYLWGTAIWLLGFALLALYQLFLLYRTQRLLRTAFSLNDRVLLEKCMKQVGVKQKVAFCRADVFDTPVVLGFVHPKIVLPSFMDPGDDTELRYILLHELVHIHRRDHWFKLLAVVTVALHWFNPVVWLCYREYRKNIETSCDEKVLSLLEETEKTGYARTLLALGSLQKSRFNATALAFMEKRSLLSTRVMGALAYKPLSRPRKALLSLAMIVLALLLTTNPVAAYDGYIPSAKVIDKALYAQYEDVAHELCNSLAEGDVEQLLALSRYDEPYYLGSYALLAEEPLAVTHYRLYPQSEQLVYAYLLCADNNQFVAQLTQNDEGVKLLSLQPERTFAASQRVAETEPVRFVRNLHRFGIVGGDKAPSDWSVAGFCISEEHHDRVKRGEIPADTVLIPEAWVQSAAKVYFGREDFSYTLDEEMYDEEQGCYLFDPQREDPANAQVLICEMNGDQATVTAKLYRDPLKLFAKATIRYQLQKKA